MDRLTAARDLLGPDIFAAMEQQLGLQIRKAKAQVDVMVIDKVSKPSEN